MERGNPRDPLLRQVLPLDAELARADLPLDAVGDVPAQRASGLLQKYQGRALLVLTGACAVNCRFCFRRHFPYDMSPKGFGAWEPALANLARDRSIEEVILSGGDPFAITDAWLEQLSKRLGQIGHLKRLRIHTRFPVVIPERLGEHLLTWLSASRLQPIVVLHINHPREMTNALAAGVRELLGRGVLVLNQSVLLAGVNDDVLTLQQLSERLLEARILPYYLHQLDRVQGVTHFEVSETTGRALIESLRQRLPGYAIPRYVREIPGMPGKTVLV
jgi:EF-P beta-lysylation protein EpmB